MKDTDNIDSEFAFLFIDELIEINNTKQNNKQNNKQINKQDSDDLEYELEEYEIKRLTKILKHFCKN